MTTGFRFVLTSLALTAITVVRAESFSAEPAPGRSIGSIVALLDSDRDGILSAQEIAAAPVALAALDRNEDGLISPAERRATTTEGRAVRPWRGSTSFNVVLTLDANLDGNIQSMEIANAVSSLKRLDRNSDGDLTPNELRPVLVARNRH